MTLGEFLFAAGNSRSAWNCSTLAGDWLVALGYPDLFAPWRDVVAEPEIEAATCAGLLPPWELAIGDSFPTVTPPFRAGDIAVLNVRGVEAGAVFAGERWATRKSKGLCFFRLDDQRVVKAWRP